MRGKGSRACGIGGADGITPAYAGKSVQPYKWLVTTQDHPRVCGEKFTTLHGENDFWGSPPRMRGKACGLFQLVESPGITPAYAGKREGPKNAQSKVGDHPRVCGEKEICRKTQNIVPGSPPRMRGKASSHFCTCSTFGITPAYAGKSTCSFGHPLASRDHPRVCGEKSGLMRSNATGTGSPPRMRGKGLVPYVPRLVQGITPAYAGKRLKRSHRIGHFSCILCLFHSVLHRASASGGSRAGPCAPPCLPAQNAVPV